MKVKGGYRKESYAGKVTILQKKKKIESKKGIIPYGDHRKANCASRVTMP